MASTCSSCNTRATGGANRLLKCSACKTVQYCNVTCQKKHWKEHKEACKAAKAAAPLTIATNNGGDDDYDDFDDDGDDTTRQMKMHHREFKRIIKENGLDSKKKSDAISRFLTDAEKRSEVSASEFATKFGITVDEAKTFLSFVHIGLRFKEEALQGAEELQEQTKKMRMAGNES